MMNSKEWKKYTNEEKVSYLEGLFDDSKKALQKNHFEWYMNYLFIRGNHYASYNTVTNRLEIPPRKRGEVRIVVNKVKSNQRAVKNYLNKTEPKWDVIPGDIDEETITNARHSGKLLDYIYRKLHLEGMVSGVVDNVLNTSIGWVELDWDDKAEKGMGQVKVKLHDSFDIYPDIRGYIYGGRFNGSYLFKAIKKTVQEVMSDERYNKTNRKEVEPDDKLSESTMKSRLLRKESGSLEDEKTKRVTVKECYLYFPDENKIKMITYAGGQILREKNLKKKTFPLIPMQVDMNPNKVIQRSWTADAIPLNKALDRAVSQMIMYGNQALVYRILAEKGHGVKEINNESGIVYEINPNRKFEVMNMNPYPSTGEQIINLTTNFIEDVLGAHEASMGSLPAGARSGKTLEALQAADSINLNGLTQSLTSFLSVLGEEILEIVSEKYVASRVIKLTEPEEGSEYAQIIGEGAKNKPEGSKIITGDNEVIVKIGSWLGHTKESQIENLKELVQLGVIPAEEVLRHLEFPNIDEISKKAREERLEKHQMDAEIAGRTQGNQQSQDMIELADKETMEMANGAQIPPTEGATMEHTEAHIDFSKSDTFMGLPPETQQIIKAHYVGELERM